MNTVFSTWPLKYMLLLIAGIFFIGCGPIKVLTLKPDNEKEGQYVNGTLFRTRSMDSVDIKLAFLERRGANIVFYVEILNSGNTPLLISPEHFLRFSGDTLKAYFKSAPEIPIDPESRITEINRRIDSENRSYGISSGISAVGSLVTLAVDVATIGKKRSKEEIEKEEKEKAEERVNRANAQYNHEKELFDLNNEKMDWSTQALRKNTLYKGQFASGKLYFPYLSEHKYTSIVVYINDHPLSFNFLVKWM